MAEFNLFGAEGVRNTQRGGQQVWEDTTANIQGMRNQFTNTQAGRAYAGGDRQGAARMLAQGGNIDGARTLENDIQGDFDRAYKMERQGMADERQAGDDERAATQRKVEVLVKVAQGLKGVAPGERAQALQRALPVFQQIGVDPATFSTLTEDQLSDDQLDIFAGEIEKQWTFHNLGGGGIGRSNARDGTFETMREPTERAPAGFQYGPDGDLSPIPGYVAGRAAIAGATRAPPRSGGGGKPAAAGPRPTGRKF